MNRSRTLLIILLALSLLALVVSTSFREMRGDITLPPPAPTAISGESDAVDAAHQALDDVQADVVSPAADNLAMQVEKLTEAVDALLIEVETLREESVGLQRDVELLKESLAADRGFQPFDVLALAGVLLSAVGLVLNFSSELRERRADQVELAQKVLDLERAAFALEQSQGDS